ncbi:MAG: hypothetical protein HGA45_02695 [Chloroflexales bacterium]|nr:hypothetical protein [Chloroflexales bacterium]
MSDPIRPADLALFLLASGETLPRKRARDQQADIAGLELKRRVLDLLVAYDPEPDTLELCLARIVEELGPPTGPTRGICSSIRDEWEMAAATPGFIDWLLDQALFESQRSGEKGGKRRGKVDR